MKALPRLIALSALAVVAGVLHAAAAVPPHARPNIVIIFTDDQGYADLGCYGAEGFATPHIDRMAAEGVRFTSFYAQPICSASRAALLTGRYPLRVGVTGALSPRAPGGLAPSEVTIAEVLKPLGYATACVGKWHLGRPDEYLPTNQGFDSYFGIPYSNDMTPDARLNPNPPARKHPPLPILRGTQIIETDPDQTQLVRRYTEEALKFLRESKDEPFFLYLAHNLPHVPLSASADFAGKTKRGIYGDVMQEIDWSVGQVLRTLKELGVDGNTLVIYTSDNGPWLVKGEHGGSAKPLREGKGSSFEGGFRVPMIARWPGRIPSGKVCNQMAATLDFLPTIAALTGGQLPTDRPIDGKDISKLLLHPETAKTPREVFYFYVTSDLQAVRRGQWKLHIPHGYRSIEGAKLATPTHPGTYTNAKIELSLYDMGSDPGETTNVAAKHPEIVAELQKLIDFAREEIGDRDKRAAGVRPPAKR